MTKLEFLSTLRDGLSGLPEEDVEASVDYYSEMIDDRIEDGIAEEAAVEAVGPIDEVVAGILADMSLPKLVKAKAGPKRSLRAWEIVLLALGSPIWLFLLLATGIVAVSAYVVVWAAVAVLYAAMAAFGAGAAAGLIGTLRAAAGGGAAQGFMYLGAGLVCAGLAILTFHLSNLAAKGAAALGSMAFTGIKRRFVRKDAA